MPVLTADKHFIYITTGTIELNLMRSTRHIGKNSLLKSPIMLIQNLSLTLQISTDHPIQSFPNLHIIY